MLFSVVRSDKDPDTLANICLECICKNLSNIFPQDERGLEMGPDMVLPKEICESLIEAYQLSGRTIDDRFANLFSDRRKSTLQKVTLWNSSITNRGLKELLQFYLKELDLAYCKNLSSLAFELINDYGKNLRSLSIGSDVQLVPSDFLDALSTKTLWQLDGGNEDVNCCQYIIKAPNLQRLVLKEAHQSSQFYATLLLALPKLTCLDLSCCKDLGDLSYLSHCPNLTSLTLFNCANLQHAIPSICQLTKLRHLDISQIEEIHGTFENENQILKRIIASLPHLVSLDISGTNLAGKGNVEKDLFDEAQEYHSDIPGLAGRAKNPLEFLGLYYAHHQASQRHDIPAIRISGDTNEEQILTAGAVYMNRPQMLLKVLNDLFHFLRANVCENIPKILAIILEGLNTHVQDKYIQISGIAALFYIVRHKNPNLLTQSVKKLVISTLLNSMTLHMRDETMLRNGCLTLCQFRIPQDILFVYRKLVKLLLQIIMPKEQEGFVQRIGIYLMNSLACQVNDTQKEILGNLGIIQKMLTLINNRIEKELCDDVLEVAWSTMWNVTDETPVNCKRFLNSNGMTCFMDCLGQFREKNELMRNMMGLLGNVAEVKELRPRLIPYMRTFYDLVDSQDEGIEVSYNAAGVISHIASDGDNGWDQIDLNREAVLKRMVDVIKTWNLKSERNINYRSFEPILKLTRVKHTPACQLWAIWALANLTEVYPEKYCPILEAEGGLEDVRALIKENNREYPQIRLLAVLVLKNHANYSLGVAQQAPEIEDAMYVVEINE